jgi:microcystin-dependent protein
MIVSDTPPASPLPGQQWFESDTGNTFLWYTDADSSQWVQQSNAGTPGSSGDAGVVQMFACAAPPAGWLKANGALVSRTTYSNLFAAIGVVWGAGDGSTTFALPDLRGEFIRVWDDSRGIDAGRTFGSAQVGDLAPHTHTFTGTALGTHDHTVGNNSANHTHSFSDASSATGTASANHNHTIPVYGGQNANTGHVNASGDSTLIHGGVPDEAQSGAAHTHTVAVSGTTGANSVAHTHDVVANSAGTPAGTIGSFGGTETRPRNVALLACVKY